VTRPVTLALLLAAAAGGCSGAPDPAAAPAPTPPVATAAPTTTTSVPDDGGRVVDVYTAAVGDCFDLRTRADDRGRETTYHLVVACDLPHEREVFAVIPFAGPAGYPGAEALRRFARLECPRPFGDYVGRRFELSTYGLSYELPTPEQWAATPSVGCTATGPDGGRTAGSARATDK
jgi:hypothetical protein